MKNKSYEKYLNKEVGLRTASDNIVRYYQGIVLGIDDTFLTIDDRKVGRLDIPIHKIIEIKEKSPGEI